MRLLIMAVMVGFSSFLASGAAAPLVSGDAASDAGLVLRLLESGSVGLSFAVSMVLAVRWLATHLLEAKDDEVKRWRELAEKNAANSEAVRELAREMVAATQNLRTTLERLDASGVHRAMLCAQVARDMHGKPGTPPTPPGA